MSEIKINIKPEHKTTKEQKYKPKNKPIAQEIIDLEADNEQKKTFNPAEHLMSDLGKKCNVFFSWISNTSSPQLAEQLWKEHMLEEAALRFPELNHQELVKLVDRDWNYMNEQERTSLVEEYSRCPKPAQLSQIISQCSIPGLL